MNAISIARFSAFAALALWTSQACSAGLIVLDEQRPTSISASATWRIPFVAGTDPQTGAPIIEYGSDSEPVPASTTVNAGAGEFAGHFAVSWGLLTFISAVDSRPSPPPLEELNSSLVNLEYDLRAAYYLRFQLLTPHEYGAYGDSGLDGRNDDVHVNAFARLTKEGGGSVFGLSNLDRQTGLLDPGIYELTVTADQSHSGGIPEWFTARCFSFGSLDLHDLGGPVPDAARTVGLLALTTFALISASRRGTLR